jgi:diacylglycerol kinase (ATP)
MNYFFIINPKSGLKRKKKHIINKINTVYKHSKHTCQIAYTEGAGDATRLAQQAILEKYDVVVAAGGDGTINEVATGLIGSSIPLGILPIGSGNGLARSLSIPLEIDAALALLLSPSLMTMDVGLVNKRLFIGVCGVGFDANLGKKYQAHGTRGTLPYFVIGVKAYIQFRSETFTIESDNQVLTIAPLLITVANTRQYGAGAIIAPAADCQDGLLNVCILERVSFPKAIRTLPLLFNGRIYKSKYYHHFLCRSVKITCQNPQGYIHTDGEPWPRDKILDIRIKPSALRVCVSCQNSRDRSQETGDQV